MASDRLIRDMAGRAALFGAGVAVVVCARYGLWACTVVLAAAGAWIALESASEAQRRAPPAAAAEPGLDAARAEGRMLSSLLDQTPAPLVTLSRGGAVSAANRAARALFRSEAVARSPALAEALDGDAEGARAAVVLDTEAGPRTYALSMADLVGPQGPVRMAALLDIQPELHAAEAAALREMMQVLSHEIMNALTPVASLVASAEDLLAEGGPDAPAQARAALAIAGRRAQGLARFVEGYRSLARLPPPQLAPLGVRSLVAQSARLFRSRWPEPELVLDLVLPTPDIVVQADEDLLIHALANLLANAAYAALASPARPARVALGARPHRGGVRLSVGDSGGGLAPELRDSVFTPFFTTKAEGAGVGLSFARQVARSHGGDVVAAPAGPLGGAEFHLDI